MRKTLSLTILLWMCGVSCAFARDTQKFETAPVAEAFGSSPAMWGLRLSPDGTKISFISRHVSGATIAVVVDSRTSRPTLVLAGKPDHFRISWCDWKNNERLLCGLRYPVVSGDVVYPETRLVAVDADAKNMKVLLQSKLRDQFAQLQDRIVDWLPDDPQHVLVQMPSGSGNGVDTLNVYDGTVSVVERPRPFVRRWISDGHGTPRLYERVSMDEARWYVRDTPDADWTLLDKRDLGEVMDDGFTPIGFADSRNELLAYERVNGLIGLFGVDLAAGHKWRLIYQHPSLDLAGVETLGKFKRLVAVAYVDDRPHLHFFDKRTKVVEGLLQKQFPEQNIAVTDEDWSRRFYLVFVRGARHPGVYYRFDTKTGVLAKISDAYPKLAGRSLNPMRMVQYHADDGVEVPAYLTVPESRKSGPGPAVILPHGGPSARDYWTYDFLAQFLAAKGYTVLQSNYRGSAGYGAAWEGMGGFRNWKQAVHDITDGAEYLVAKGLADPKRICIVGWSYGGYAALMSAIEHPKLYQCVVSVAGVTDPGRLGSHMMRNFVGGMAARTFIGTDDNVRKAGSPVERVDEIQIPVLMFQGKKDMNVPFNQGREMNKALERADKQVEFITYENAEHSIRPPRDRIDLLTRIGEFLGQHISAAEAGSHVADGVR